jgi:hypothetical protein
MKKANKYDGREKNKQWWSDETDFLNFKTKDSLN